MSSRSLTRARRSALRLRAMSSPSPDCIHVPCRTKLAQSADPAGRPDHSQSLQACSVAVRPHKPPRPAQRHRLQLLPKLLFFGRRPWFGPPLRASQERQQLICQNPKTRHFERTPPRAEISLSQRRKPLISAISSTKIAKSGVGTGLSCSPTGRLHRSGLSGRPSVGTATSNPAGAFVPAEVAGR
jgi:hypothetical protein